MDICFGIPCFKHTVFRIIKAAQKAYINLLFVPLWVWTLCLAVYKVIDCWFSGWANFKDLMHDSTSAFGPNAQKNHFSEDDFRQLKPSDSLRAIYNESLNDFMSVAFLPSYGRLFIPLFFGLLAVVLMRKVIFRRNQPPVSWRSGE